MYGRRQALLLMKYNVSAYQSTVTLTQPENASKDVSKWNHSRFYEYPKVLERVTSEWQIRLREHTWYNIQKKEHQLTKEFESVVVGKHNFNVSDFSRNTVFLIKIRQIFQEWYTEILTWSWPLLTSNMTEEYVSAEGVALSSVLYTWPEVSDAMRPHWYVTWIRYVHFNFQVIIDISFLFRDARLKSCSNISKLC